MLWIKTSQEISDFCVAMLLCKSTTVVQTKIMIGLVDMKCCSDIVIVIRVSHAPPGFTFAPSLYWGNNCLTGND